MAQLPDENVIAMPQPGSRRPVSSIDASGYARGAAAVGSGVETLGKGMTSAAQDVAAVLRVQREAQENAQGKREQARAKATLNAALINRGNAIETATDPAGLPESVQTGFGEDIEIASRAIKDPRERELFVLAARAKGARLASAAVSRASDLAREASKANDIATLNVLAEGAIRSSDPEAVPMVVQSASDVIDGWNWMDRREADAAKARFAQDFALRRFNALPLAERHAAFGGGRYAELVAAMPDETFEQTRTATRREFAQARVKASYDALDATRQALDDATNGLAPLPSWESIASNPHLESADRDRARALYDAAVRNVAALQHFDEQVDNPAGAVFDPENPTTRSLANRSYISRKRMPEALLQIAQRTNIIPDDAVTSLRRALASDSIDQVQQAMQLLSEIPDQAFVNLKGGRDLAEARETYRAKFTVWGAPAKAAQDYIKERTAEAVTPALQKQKREAVDKILEPLTHQEMKAYLRPDGGDWSAAPYEVGSSNAERDRALYQFKGVVRDVYLEQRSSDINEAMAKAALRFKATFGLSTAYGPDPTDPKQKWGEPRLTRFAPSAWSGYAARGNELALLPDEIDGLMKEAAADYIESQMRDPSGWRMSRDKIMLRPVDFARTEAPFMAGNPARPPKYLVAYEDQRGLIQLVGIWGAGPDVLRAIKARRKQAEFAAGDAAANANIDALEQRPAFQDF